MDVRMPDGVLVRNVPDNVTQADLLSRYELSQKPDAGNVINTDVPTVVGSRPNAVNPQPQARPVTMMDRVKALYEVPTAIAGSMVTEPLAQAYGIARSIPEAIQTGQAPAQIGQKYAQQASQAMQYQPTSPVSQEALGAVGEALTAAKIPAFTPVIGKIPSAMQAAGAIRPMIQESVIPAGRRMAGALRNEGQMIQEAIQPITSTIAGAVEPVTSRIASALRREPTMAGVGAAEVPEARTRYERAQNLPVPIQLSKGEATKDFAQQAFEIETAKNFPDTSGKALIQGKADRNDAILKNFDAFVDANDKEFFSLRKVGKVVDDALTKSYDKDAAAVRAAYEKARAEGAMQDPIDYSPLTAYIEKQAPTVRAKLSPILDVVDEEIARNDLTKTGAMPINALEDIYRVINENYDFNAPKHFIEMKQIINKMTENKGGEAYTVAKKLRQNLANKYENSSYVDKLLNTKKGYNKDRMIALEDVFKHSILDGSLDDVKAIGYVLKTSGEDGKKALNELKGQTIQYIKDEVTKSTKNDINGNSIVSPARFKAIVKELDDDEKLDYLFGKQNAQKIRDLLETTLDVHTNVDGSANYSNSSSAIIRGLDFLGKFPIPKALGAKTVSEMAKSRELKKKVEESLNYTPEGMADALRKTK